MDGKVFLLGVGLVFGALWGGAYYLHVIGKEHWTVVPTLVTLVLIGVLGVGVIIGSSIDE